MDSSTLERGPGESRALPCLKGRALEADDELSRAPGFEERFRQIRETNRRGAEVLLEHAKPTEVGQSARDENRRWDDYDRAYEG